jgi:hypothetical protein
MPWFHGKITRELAEELLHPRTDGLYLIRESTNYPGDYTLCVVANNAVDHYRIITTRGKISIDEEEFFDSLEELIAHYEKDSDGLSTRLVWLPSYYFFCPLIPLIAPFLFARTGPPSDQAGRPRVYRQEGV